MGHMAGQAARPEKRPIEAQVEQFEVPGEQVSVGRERADSAAVKQKVSPWTARHSGQASARLCSSGTLRSPESPDLDDLDAARPPQT